MSGNENVKDDQNDISSAPVEEETDFHQHSSIAQTEDKHQISTDSNMFNSEDLIEKLPSKRIKRKAGKCDIKQDKQHKSLNMDPQRIEEEDMQIRSILNMKCDLCHVTFNIFRESKSHYRDEHNINGYLICCEKKFFKRNQLIEHLQRHINPNGIA